MCCAMLLHENQPGNPAVEAHLDPISTSSAALPPHSSTSPSTPSMSGRLASGAPPATAVHARR
jgi:hypothetical protein